MTKIGRRTVSLVDLGSRSVAHTSQPGRPKFVIAEELLENLRSVPQYLVINEVICMFT